MINLKQTQPTDATILRSPDLSLTVIPQLAVVLAAGVDHGGR